MSGSKERVDFSLLVDWVEGRLPEDEVRAVEEQVSRADSRALESPPQEVRDALMARFEAHVKGRQTPGFLTRVLASLTFDSNLRPAVGLRAAGAQQARRQLVYSADAFDVALNFRSRVLDKYVDLEGQVFPHDDEELEPFVVQLLQVGTERALTATDELGSFAVRDISPGTYEMVLSTDTLEISIARVALSA